MPSAPATWTVIYPFYRQGTADGTLTHDLLKSLQCFWIKFNNQPPRWASGPRAAYTDFK